MAHASTPAVFVAHRGVGGAAQVRLGIPENSIPAWDWAIKNTTEPNLMVDMDVQITSDGHFVVMHDATIDRTTNRSGRVRDRSLAYIKAAYLELDRDLDGNGNDDNTPWRPPSLNQALDFLKTKTVAGAPVRLTIETKGSGWTQSRINRLYTLINEKGLRSRVNVHAFSLSVTSMLKTAGFPDRAYVNPSDDPCPSNSVVLKYAHGVFLNIATPGLTKARVDDYAAAGIKVWVWTLDKPGEFDKAIALGPGVHAWITDELLVAQQRARDAGMA